jgi:SAM-dependent methyltransferase
MRKRFIEVLRCKTCGSSSLKLRTVVATTNEINEGEILCKNCQAVVQIKDGIPEFLYDLPEDVLDEIDSSEGVSKFCYPKEPEVYNDEWLLSLPYVTDKKVNNYEGWQAKIQTFEQALNDFPEGHGEKLLDIGASTTWTTRYFARKGYDCIALDIVKGLYRGLSSSEVFFKHENIYYERLLAPMENIPLRNDSIDCVFSINSLHHSKNLAKVFSEISRILKPDGYGYLVDDTVGYLLKHNREKEAKQAREINKHNDHVYSLSDYKKVITDSRLHLEMILPLRFRQKIGILSKIPESMVRIIYVFVSIVRGTGFIFKVKKL